MPRPLTAMQHACGRSTTSGSRNSILSGAMTFGWCVVGGNVANRTGTTASLWLRPSARAAAVPPRRDATSAHLQVVSESSGRLPSPSPSSTCRRPGPAEQQISLPDHTLWPETVNGRFLTPSTITG
jgi:hypothetical protein